MERKGEEEGRKEEGNLPIDVYVHMYIWTYGTTPTCAYM